MSVSTELSDSTKIHLEKNYQAEREIRTWPAKESMDADNKLPNICLLYTSRCV